MFKALTALAFSMTGAAALLAWLEPKDRPSALARALRNVDAFVRSAISTADPLVPAAWRGVQIVRTPSADGWERRTLTAVLPEGDHHFRVLESGEVETLTAWHEQRFEPSQGAIRILVPCGAADGVPVEAQWYALRSLLIELQTLAASSTADRMGPWLVTLSDDLAVGSGLRSLLRGEGFLS